MHVTSTTGVVWLMALSLWPSAATAGQAPAADPPYVVRGHQTEVRQRTAALQLVAAWYNFYT